MRVLGSLFLLALGSAGLFAGCEDEDTGICCTAVTPAGKLQVPVPDRPAGQDPRDIIRANPKFECEQLVCTSYQGSDPFCTRPCSEGKPCTEGFECVDVVTSDPGPTSQFRPGDKYCVRQACSATVPCKGGEDFECLDSYTNGPVGMMSGTSTQAPSAIGLCVKKEHKCVKE